MRLSGGVVLWMLWGLLLVLVVVGVSLFLLKGWYDEVAEEYWVHNPCVVDKPGYVFVGYGNKMVGNLSMVVCAYENVFGMNEYFYLGG